MVSFDLRGIILRALSETRMLALSLRVLRVVVTHTCHGVVVHVRATWGGSRATP